MSLVLKGRIVKKRKRSEWIVLTLIDEGDDNHNGACGNRAETAGSSSSSLGCTVYVSRRPPSSTIKGASYSISFPVYLFYLNAIICVHGDVVASLDGAIVTPTNRTLPHPKSEESPVAATTPSPTESFLVARAIDLLQCAPDPQAVQAVVEAFLKNRINDQHNLLSTLLPYSLTMGCVSRCESPNAALLEQDNGLRYLEAKRQVQKLIESMQRIDSSDGVGEKSDSASSDASKVAHGGPSLTTTERRSSPSMVYATIVYNLLHGINDEGNDFNVSDRASMTVEPLSLKRRAPRNRVRRIQTSDLDVLQQAEASMLLGSSKTRPPMLVVKSTVAVSDDTSATELDQDRACSAVMHDSSSHEVPATSNDAFESESIVDCSALPLMSCRGHQSRHDYLVAKKLPQVLWMVDRIAAMIARRRRPFAHILDVGGGRGDLALALAQRFFATTKVTVVDRNATSVAAGQARAEAWNPAACRDGKLRFIVADFQAYATSSVEASAGKGTDGATLTPVDLVVALHACGDLSDAALYHATHTLQGCSFLICPCCYTKRYLTKSFWEPALSRSGSFLATTDTAEPVHVADANQNSIGSTRNPFSSWDAPTISTLLRLAELNEHPNVRHRAATLINMARLQRSVDNVQLCHAINESDEVQQRPTCKTNNSYSTLQLEEFSNSYSTRNLVLVGIAVFPPGRSNEDVTR